MFLENNIDPDQRWKYFKSVEDLRTMCSTVGTWSRCKIVDCLLGSVCACGLRYIFIHWESKNSLVMVAGKIPQDM